MNLYQQPWWVLAIQLPVLETILKEDHRADQKRFVITGQPILKSLTWVTYGPACAVIAVLIVGLLAWRFEVKAQPPPTKILVVCGMVLLPGLFWIGGGGGMNKLMQKPLQRQREAGRKQVVLILDVAAKTLQFNQETPITYQDVVAFNLITAQGLHYDPQEESGSLLNLVLETNQGPVTLLPKDLGTTQQKLQLINQLQIGLKGD